VETLDTWAPGVKEVAARHGVRMVSLSRFVKGENPVFNINENVVVKLLPHGSAHLALREIECLKWLTRCKTVPVPTLLGSGQIEDWNYLISTKLPGRLLSEQWAELGEVDQETLATELGQLLAALHKVPLEGFCPGGVRWRDFLLNGTASWIERPSVTRLPARLRDSGIEYIANAQLNQYDHLTVFLHGDLAPENCLVSATDGSWHVAGIFDFGNAMAGHTLFDFTALTVLMAPGNARVLKRLFEGYGIVGNLSVDLRRQLMAYTLLHPLGDISQILRLIPGLDRCTSWDEVAQAFWPIFAMPLS